MFMWAIPCKSFVCLQLQDTLTCLGLCKTTLKHSSRKCGGLYCRARLPENASCLEGSPHSSGSSGYTWGRTSGRTCARDREKQMSLCQQLEVAGSMGHEQHGPQIKQQIKQHSLLLAHSSLFYDKGSFLCNNTFKILRKMPPCISILELLSEHSLP